MLALHMISLPTATFFGSQAGDTTGETEKALRPSTGSRTLPKSRRRKQFFRFATSARGFSDGPYL